MKLLIDLMVQYGGEITIVTDKTHPVDLQNAKQTGRFYEDGMATGKDFMWSPPIDKIPTTEAEVEFFERWYPIGHPLPEGLQNADFLFKKVFPRKAVKWFAEEMEKKLKANDHKGGWNKCTMQYLSMRLTQERKELYAALANRDSGSYFGDTHNDQEIIGECADIANFAMMIADRFGPNHGK